MDNYVKDYIAQRMSEIGYTSFHYEAVRVTDTGNSKIVRAYNEYYYLVSNTVPASLQIFSDTNVFTEAAGYSGFSHYGIQEFTGLIEIKQAVPIDLEFIQVIPN